MGIWHLEIKMLSTNNKQLTKLADKDKNQVWLTKISRPMIEILVVLIYVMIVKSGGRLVVKVLKSDNDQHTNNDHSRRIG